MSAAPMTFTEPTVATVGQENGELPFVFHGASASRHAHAVCRIGHYIASKAAPAPRFMVEVIAEVLSKVPHVRRVLLGRSGEIHHVWTLTDEWTAEARRQIYAAQKRLLEELSGFELDFYVVRAESQEEIDQAAAGIPEIFRRT